MKLVICSDTHGQHGYLKMPEGDIFIHCGDSTETGEIWEYKNFLAWVANLKYKHKIIINGNHEITVEKMGLVKQIVREFNKYHFANVTYLEEEGVTVEGLKFWGSPKTPEFFDWAYMYKREDGERQWLGVPDDVDVLITHGPPKGIMDKVKATFQYPETNAGCEYLIKKVKEVKPKLHCFGHIHYTAGHLKPANPAIPTLFVNAAICNSRNVAVNKPTVVDTETWEVC